MSLTAFAVAFRLLIARLRKRAPQSRGGDFSRHPLMARALSTARSVAGDRPRCAPLRRRRAGTALLLLPVLAGCAHEQVPAYPRMSEQETLTVLRDRSHAIRTISAQGLVTLTRGNGDSVRLDAVVVMQPPDRARLRAWKFAQAVFDMTLTPDGLWIIVPEHDEHRPDLRAAGSNTAQLTRQWLQLMTGSFDNLALALRPNGGKLLLTEANDDGTTMYCEIDRLTLTPRRYVIKDRVGAERFSLTLGDYAEFGGIAWPRKVEAVSQAGRILIELRDVEINGDLPPGVFHPPARAEKMP
jgi:outer membrane lipoprotein-sorting protein